MCPQLALHGGKMAAEVPSIISRSHTNTHFYILAYIAAVTVGETEIEDPEVLIKDSD